MPSSVLFIHDGSVKGVEGTGKDITYDSLKMGNYARLEGGKGLVLVLPLMKEPTDDEVRRGFALTKDTVDTAWRELRRSEEARTKQDVEAMSTILSDRRGHGVVIALVPTWRSSTGGKDRERLKGARGRSLNRVINIVDDADATLAVKAPPIWHPPVSKIGALASFLQRQEPAEGVEICGHTQPGVSGERASALATFGKDGRPCASALKTGQGVWALLPIVNLREMTEDDVSDLGEIASGLRDALRGPGPEAAARTVEVDPRNKRWTFLCKGDQELVRVTVDGLGLCLAPQSLRLLGELAKEAPQKVTTQSLLASLGLRNDQRNALQQAVRKLRVELKGALGIGDELSAFLVEARDTGYRLAVPAANKHFPAW